ncbi:MAG: hypothetical protein KAS47_07840 [Candidatus Heimdallarchaeota archaeon]|nr:hypothetical protein [Candidatus Heimdallarchaeota archaeon]MCK4972477.1 hypothetical protein [Candidatus Heimdallarchaeota archaeon]
MLWIPKMRKLKQELYHFQKSLLKKVETLEMRYLI